MSEKLPRIAKEEPPDWMRERLLRWLRDWQLDQALHSGPNGSPRQTLEDDLPPPGETAADAVVEPDATTPDPSPGQVRLLSPEIPAGREAPLYFLVVGRSEAEPESYIIAPFSRFSEPATDEELLVKGLAPGLGAVQIWNTAVLPGRIVSRSWLSGEVSREELRNALAVYRHAIAGEELPMSVQTQVGPPLLHPDDPRHEYVEQEAERTDALQVYVEAMQNRSRPPLIYERPTSAYAIAAEKHGTYEVPRRYTVEGAHTRLRAVPGATPGKWIVHLETPAGERDPSLDGAILRSASGVGSPPVRNASVTVSEELLAEALTLVTPDGRELDITGC